jgi:nucleoside-diphosphate-sugar epimerase
VRLLVTGATGFVGRNLLSKFGGSDGVSLVCAARHRGALRGLTCTNVEIIETGDLFQKSEQFWRETCRDIDVLVHLAWSNASKDFLHSDIHLQCLEGTMRLFRGATAAGVKRIVGVGTCHEYKFSSEPLTEESVIMPSSLYAAGKASTFFLATELCRARSISFSWCRLFYLYGRFESQDRLFPYVERQLKRGETAVLSTGEAVRDYMDVEVAASQLKEVVLSDIEGAVNICSGVRRTILSYCEEIADKYRARDLIIDRAVPYTITNPPIILGASRYFS